AGLAVGGVGLREAPREFLLQRIARIARRVPLPGGERRSAQRDGEGEARELRAASAGLKPCATGRRAVGGDLGLFLLGHVRCRVWVAIGRSLPNQARRPATRPASPAAVTQIARAPFEKARAAIRGWETNASARRSHSAASAPAASKRLSTICALVAVQACRSPPRISASSAANGAAGRS